MNKYKLIEISNKFVEKDKGVSDVLNKIVKDIDKIKSYGIKGKKRLFGGYNQERKVRNRKLKEKHRRANKIKTPTRKRIINSVSDEYIDNESNNTRKGFN